MSDMVARCFRRILAKRMEIFLPFNIRQKAFRAGDGTAESVWFLQQLIQKHKDQLSPLNVAFVAVGRRLCRRQESFRLGLAPVDNPGSKTPGCAATAAFVLDRTLLGRMDNHPCGRRAGRGDSWRSRR